MWCSGRYFARLLSRIHRRRDSDSHKRGRGLGLEPVNYIIGTILVIQSLLAISLSWSGKKLISWVAQGNYTISIYTELIQDEKTSIRMNKRRPKPTETTLIAQGWRIVCHYNLFQPDGFLYIGLLWQGRIVNFGLSERIKPMSTKPALRRNCLSWVTWGVGGAEATG